MQQHCFRRSGAEKFVGTPEDAGDWQEHISHGVLEGCQICSQKWMGWTYLSSFTLKKEREHESSKMIAPVQYLLNSDRWTSESCGYSDSEHSEGSMPCCLNQVKVPTLRKKGAHPCWTSEGEEWKGGRNPAWGG